MLLRLLLCSLLEKHEQRLEVLGPVEKLALAVVAAAVVWRSGLVGVARLEVGMKVGMIGSAG